MDNKVLLAYASTHGSTQEVAEFITRTLHEHGFTVELLPARAVRSLEGFDGVILGAPLYMFRWHKDALRFLGKHKKELSTGLPIAVFAGGSIESMDEMERQEVRKQLDQELANFPWLKPVAVEVIGGRFDPNRLRFPWSLLPALRQKPPIDLRDWDAIRSWTTALAELFQPVISH
jgi:menaquinone-dependent protoporphyrinogen oxidase